MVLALNHREPYKEERHDVDEHDPQSPVVKPNTHAHVSHHAELHC